ncbi:MAG: hypothetical protein IPH08_04925 [Rhodocyclaceae bacterium]|nr:hypothetical protein [Rhodocyclaceae bacterium]
MRSCVERLQVVCDVLGSLEPGAGEQFSDLFDALFATLALFVELLEAIFVPLDEVGRGPGLDALDPCKALCLLVRINDLFEAERFTDVGRSEVQRETVFGDLVQPRADGGQDDHRLGDGVGVTGLQCPEVGVGGPDTHAGEAGAEPPCTSGLTVEVLESG